MFRTRTAAAALAVIAALTLTGCAEVGDFVGGLTNSSPPPEPDEHWNNDEAMGEDPAEKPKKKPKPAEERSAEEPAEEQPAPMPPCPAAPTDGIPADGWNNDEAMNGCG